LRYTDKKFSEDEKIPGFASLFRKAKAEQKYYGFFPGAIGNVEDPKEWEAFFNEGREDRFASERKITFKNMFYKFLDARVVNDYEPEKDEFFYTIPRGFTKSAYVSLEDDFDEGGMLYTLKDVRFRFFKVGKTSEGVGICRLVST
jgi:hypothetical protein